MLAIYLLKQRPSTTTNFSLFSPPPIHLVFPPYIKIGPRPPNSLTNKCPTTAFRPRHYVRHTRSMLTVLTSIWMINVSLVYVPFLLLSRLRCPPLLHCHRPRRPRPCLQHPPRFSPRLILFRFPCPLLTILVVHMLMTLTHLASTILSFNQHSSSTKSSQPRTPGKPSPRVASKHRVSLPVKTIVFLSSSVHVQSIHPNKP